MNKKPLIRLFKTNEKYYMYDANKNTIINITDVQYEFLENCMKNNTSDYIDSELTRELYKQGFLSSNRIKEIIHPDDELLSYYLENNMQMITLQITQQCNFRCEYCVYSGSYLNRGHSSKRMSIETAFKAIDFLISHSKNNKNIAIGFYGGEPLLEFDFIKQCVEYGEKKAEGKKLAFTMTTNGSLLNDEIMDFLYKHDVVLTISLDGPKEVQNNHRKLALNNGGSFDKVFSNIIKLKEKFPDYIEKVSFNAVIDPNNDFSVIDKFFRDNEIVKDVTLSSTLISGNYRKSKVKFNEEHYLQQEYEMFRIFYCLTRGKKTDNCSRIVINNYLGIVNFADKLKPQKELPEKTHPSGPCTPGVDKLFINADGNFYPCERVSESSDLMKIGNIETGFDVDKARKLLNLGKVNEDACKNCWATKFCSICAATLDTGDDEFLIKQKEECCRDVKASVQQKLKNYCFLKEMGHNFDENVPINIFND